MGAVNGGAIIDDGHNKYLKHVNDEMRVCNLKGTQKTVNDVTALFCYSYALLIKG